MDTMWYLLDLLPIFPITITNYFIFKNTIYTKRRTCHLGKRLWCLYFLLGLFLVGPWHLKRLCTIIRSGPTSRNRKTKGYNMNKNNIDHCNANSDITSYPWHKEEIFNIEWRRHQCQRSTELMWMEHQTLFFN